MSLKIATNTVSQAVINNLRSAVDNTGDGVVKLSSGKRINQAKDDAAGLGVATKLNAQNRSLRQAVRNANDGVSMIQTTEGGLNEVSNNLVRMRELAIQSASDTLGDQEREFANMEFQQLLNEVDRVSQNTQYNGVSVLKGDTGIGTFDFQIGALSSEDNIIQHDGDNFDSSASTLGIDGLGIEDKSEALDSLDSLDEAITSVGGMRAGLGAIQSRLNSSVNSLENQIINQDSALSRIEDLDMAQASADYARNNILRQTSVAMLSQANMLSSSVLKLI